MSISREVLGKYVGVGCTFIETGTRWGDTTIKAIELGATCAYTCESDPLYVGMAKAHIADALKGALVAFVYHADSVEFFKGLASANASLFVIFLDAHSETYSPVLKELAEIKKWAQRPKTILVDDMRFMPNWGISREDIEQRLTSMGYVITYEYGAVPEDILVAQQR